VLLLWFFGSLEVALWGTFALICVLFAVPVQLVATTTLTLLGMIVATQLIPAMSGYSERLAVYVFYLLVITVLLQLRSLYDEDEDMTPAIKESVNETNEDPAVLDLRDALSLVGIDTRKSTVSMSDKHAHKASAIMRYHDIKHPAF